MERKVRVTHYRACLDDDGNRVLANMKQIHEEDLLILPHGGMTEAVILENGEPVVNGVAYCNDIDQYVKKVGAAKAIVRAFAELNRLRFREERPDEYARRETARREREQAVH
jgi:hypothetical protein